MCSWKKCYITSVLPLVVASTNHLLAEAGHRKLKAVTSRCELEATARVDGLLTAGLSEHPVQSPKEPQSRK